MSIQDCMVCDQCGKHARRPPAWTGQRLPLPPTWWTFSPADEAMAWQTFCGPVCVTNYLMTVNGK